MIGTALGVLCLFLVVTAVVVFIAAPFLIELEDRRSEREWRAGRDALDRIYRNPEGGQ